MTNMIQDIICTTNGLVNFRICGPNVLIYHLNLKHRETHRCVVSTVAKAPGYQYPQYWLNIRLSGPVSYENITFLLDSIRI